MQELSLIDWAALEAQLASVLTQAEFDPRTIDNTRDLMTICRVQCAAPSGIAKGYWATIRLSWPKLEVEVFPDSFELYRFHDKSTDIEEFFRQPGEPIPEALTDQLPRLAEEMANDSN